MSSFKEQSQDAVTTTTTSSSTGALRALRVNHSSSPRIPRKRVNDATFRTSTGSVAIPLPSATTTTTTPPEVFTEQTTTNTKESKRPRNLSTNKEKGITRSSGASSKEMKEEGPADIGIYVDSDDSIMAVATPNTTLEGTNHPPPAGTVTSTKQFAPSIPAYLNQEEFQYLPRPEWFHTTGYIMKLELEAVEKEYYYSFNLVDVLGHYNEYIDYNLHLEQCVRYGEWEHPARYLNQWFDTEDAEMEFSSSHYTDVDEFRRNKIKECKASAKAKTKESLDFLNEQLQSNIIYFDTQEYIWKTQKIPREDGKLPSSEKDVKNNVIESTPPEKYCSTYETLIQRRHHIELERGDDENTILHTAIKQNATNMALEIIRIEYKTFLDCVRRNEDVKTQLHCTLLQTTNQHGFTPLVTAAHMGNIQVMQELLQCGVPLFDSEAMDSAGRVVLEAAKHGQVEVIKFMIEYYRANKSSRYRQGLSWPKRSKDFLDHPNWHGTTPLMRAAQKGHGSIVKLLLQHRAKVNSSNKYKMTPLLLAAKNGHEYTCRLLMVNGANVNALTAKSSSALLLACRWGHVEVAKELVLAGCYLQHKNKDSQTAESVIKSRIIRRREGHDRLGMFNGNNSEGEDGFAAINNVPLSSDLEMLRILNPATQIEMKRYEMRDQRNFEIVCIHNLLQHDRADIKLKGGSTYDVPTIVQRLTTRMTTTIDSESNPTARPSCENSQRQHGESQHSQPPYPFDGPGMQMLLRTMLLPMPLVKSIALFLPLPSLRSFRIDTLYKWTIKNNPNEAIIEALDIIDEILEDVGFLSAYDTAQIAAPTPYRSWLDWKRSARATATWNYRDMELDDPHHEHPEVRYETNVTKSSPLPPLDEKNPTILELRRQVGYLQLLSQSHLYTSIVQILSTKPYHVPHKYINRLIKIADIASICRRCCIAPALASSFFFQKSKN